VATFTEEPSPLDTYIATYHRIISDQLPYLVAVDDTSEKILGYANAHRFRGSKGAYRHTVEISLFCDSKHIGHGVGSALLKQLLAALKDISESGSDTRICQVLAVMSVDENSPEQGLGLKAFYERFGFQLVSVLCSHQY
jgi:phosphinothricin acetyltransferase